jgi:magnesium chelatase family protein
MIAQTQSATLVGIDAVPVVVEVDLQGGIQGDGDRYFILVGLPDKAVQESKERVRTAIRNSGLDNSPHTIKHMSND